MRNAIRLTLAAIALVSGVSVAGAAGMAQPSTKSSGGSMSQPVAKDSLSLSNSQQKTAWKDISTQAVKEPAPSGFTAKVGAALPSELTTHPVPVSTANKVPELRPYQYALLNNNKLLIVNPSDKKIAEIITQ
jgi:hypothetical protein